MFHRFLMHVWLVVYDFADRRSLESLRLHALSEAGRHCYWQEIRAAAKQGSTGEDWDL